jgi:pimeloyl-ACP methyl ester carboxylesterase
MEKVIFLPGVITPAAITYAPLLEELEGEIQPVLKDLELYATDAPPPNYGLHLEIDAILRVMDREQFDRAHFVGYSGGAAICLAFAAAHPQRMQSLAMFEPAVIPAKEWMQLAAAEWAELERIMTLPEAERTPLFIRNTLRPGVEPPPPLPGPPPPWMAKRPAGIQALVAAFGQYDFDLDALRRFERPVYLGYGLLSSKAEERKADFLLDLLPAIEIETYAKLHHFTPPQRHEPEVYASALRRLWNVANGDDRYWLIADG